MNKSKILICDDEEIIRESLKLVLSEHYPLVIVDSAEAALHVLQKDRNISVTLLDIKMPHINGLELLSIIKKKYPKNEVIMITGYNCVETAYQASQLGASGYVTKPFKSEEIIQHIERVLKKSALSA